MIVELYLVTNDVFLNLILLKIHAPNQFEFVTIDLYPSPCERDIPSWVENLALDVLNVAAPLLGSILSFAVPSIHFLNEETSLANTLQKKEREIARLCQTNYDLLDRHYIQPLCDENNWDESIINIKDSAIRCAADLNNVLEIFLKSQIKILTEAEIIFKREGFRFRLSPYLIQLNLCENVFNHAKHDFIEQIEVIKETSSTKNVYKQSLITLAQKIKSLRLDPFL